MRTEHMSGLSRAQMEHLVAGVARVLTRKHVRYQQWTALGLYKSVAMVVSLMRENFTQQVAADIFDVSQATVSRRWDQLRDAIGEATEAYRPDLSTWRGSVLVDGTLAPTWDWASNPHLYSGKHHDHGLNLQVAMTLDGDLLAVGTPIDGARHDAHAYAASGLAAQLQKLHVVADLAYLSRGALTGIRKPPNTTLNDHDSRFNTQLATIRAAVERGIAWLKNWKMLSTRYRAPLDKANSAIRAITNLHHYRNRHPRE